MNADIAYLLFFLISLTFFAIVGTAFQNVDSLLLGFNKQKKDIFTSILVLFFKNKRQFAITTLMCKIVFFVLYVTKVVQVTYPYLSAVSSAVLIFFIQLILIFLSILLFVEFISNVIAKIKPELVLKIFVLPMLIFFLLLYPITYVMLFISDVISKLFNIDIPVKNQNKTISRDELDFFIQKTREDSPDNKELDKEVRLFQNALDFSQVKIRDCIVPRTEIVALDASASVEDLLSVFIETGLSKIIVYKEDINNIIGYIHSSEMFTKPKDWTQKINSLPFVPENMSANKLMKNLLEAKKSMAVVIDEFGGTAGIIALEDLVEEIFGEIEDEHDTKTHIAKKISEDEFILSGRMDIDTVNEMFNLNIPESDEYMTVSGYILNKYQKFPKLNEKISIDNFVIHVVKMTTTKIELIRLKVNNG